jgi:D-aminopeptidase
MFNKLFFLFAISICMVGFSQEKKSIRDYGIEIGLLKTGPNNSITDVQGVLVGHVTLNNPDSIKTGVTAILPHRGNLFQQKVPAGIYIGNGFGKLSGISQVKELGNIETPIVLTNTLNISEGIQGIIDYTFKQTGNENVQSVNAVVGETNDGYLNDIRRRHIKKTDVIRAIENANSEKVKEGNVGAGTGTVCFGFKGGIGSSSRKLPSHLGGYTVGVIVQTNFGGVLVINGTHVGKELKKYYLKDQLNNTVDGSCMIVVATDAPLDSRNLERLAKRAFMGLAKTGGIASNGSGDYVIAFSNYEKNLIPHSPSKKLLQPVYLHNDEMSPLFMAAIEATEEAIINSLFKANTTKGKNNRIIEALPIEKVIPLINK